MKKLIIGISLILGAAVSASAQGVQLNGVTMTQNPQTRAVEITYELTGVTPVFVTLGIETNGIPIPDPVTAWGDVTTMLNPITITPDVTPKKIYWSPKKDWPGNVTDKARAVVTAWFTDNPPPSLLFATAPKYVVIDLSDGTNATSYPMRCTVEPPETSALSKTTELWLRHIPAGAFTMGSPNASQSPDGIAELGRYNAESLHNVTLTKDFYIGVFEVTQKQWELVMGDKPSQYAGDTRPVERVSYFSIRGGTNDTPAVEWPSTGTNVTTTSFMGRLREKTPLLFDLPTEAQWEYACRAGTTTALNSGSNLTDIAVCPNMDEVGRYNGNRSGGQHAAVGSYLPNAWGLYDMHGNVREWCLDWYQDNLTTLSAVDPKGPEVLQTTERRLARGGNYSTDARNCRSAYRENGNPTGANNNLGFRLCIQPPTVP